MKHNQTQSEINNRVKRFYEAFPYPKYPLLSRFRMQDGYLMCPGFASSLTGSKMGTNPILIAGCGDTAARIAHHWTPRGQDLFGVDVSAKNLARLRKRWLIKPKNIHLCNQDISDFLNQNRKLAFSHIDCFGVLHHLPNPTQTLRHLAQRLEPGGTMRIMVYNSAGRTWIHQFQHIFSILKLSPFSPDDRALSKKILTEMCLKSPYLRTKLSAIAPMLKNTSRYVDTFFHCREARIPWLDWIEAIEKLDFKHKGLFDRYGELDFLPNPLRAFDPLSIHEAISKGDFRGNFELYLTKKSEQPTEAHRNSFRQFITPPPNIWRNFKETANINRIKQQHIWWSFGQYLNYGTPFSSHLLRSIKPRSLQRLSRLGVLNENSASSEWHDLIASPMASESRDPHTPPNTQLGDISWNELLPGLSPEKLKLIQLRFINAAKTL